MSSVVPCIACRCSGRRSIMKTRHLCAIGAAVGLLWAALLAVTISAAGPAFNFVNLQVGREVQLAGTVSVSNQPDRHVLLFDGNVPNRDAELVVKKKDGTTVKVRLAPVT